MGDVAARDPHAARTIRDAIGDPAPRGALTRLAEQLGVKPSVVSRWYTLTSSPERTMWPAIEVALQLPHGALHQGDSAPEEIADLRRRVALLEAQVHDMLHSQESAASRALRDAESERSAARRAKRAAP